jgi:hypothetical protein
VDRLPVTAAFLCLALGIASCGGDGRSADAEAVRAAFVELRRDFAADDLDGVCVRISRAAKRQVGSIGHKRPRQCWVDVGEFADSLGKGDRGGRPKIVAVEVDGDRASVMAVLGKESRSKVPFVKEDGDWKLDSFYGNTAPPPKDLQ